MKVPNEWRTMMAMLLAQKNIHDITRADVLAAWRMMRLIEDVASDEINKWIRGEADAVT